MIKDNIDEDVKKYIEEHGIRKRPHKLETFMNIAREFEKQSSCIRNQFGAIAVTSDFTQILSIGYNGQYKNGPNHCVSLKKGKCGCLHAELNMLLKYPFGLHKNVIMLITGNPCWQCATYIINSGIERVIYDREYTSDDFAGLKLLKSAGISIEKLSDAIKA